MTVTEAFQKLDEQGVQKVKLGSESGFVYCGKIKYPIVAMLSARTKATIERDLKKRLRFAENYSEFCKKQIPKEVFKYMEAWLETHDGKPDGETMLRWWHKAEVFCEEQKKMCANSAANLKKRLDKWVDFPDRNVREVYKSETEPGVVIVIMDGGEKGEYWTYEEGN